MVRTPSGTSVVRDYATFASEYAVDGSTVAASRHLNFSATRTAAERAADYNAFVRAVQSDEAQEFTLERADATQLGSPLRCRLAPQQSLSPNHLSTPKQR